MPADPTYLCWQGNRQQPLWEVIGDARALFRANYGHAPAETLIPLTGDATLGRPVAWLFYRADRWHVAVGPVPLLFASGGAQHTAARVPAPAGYAQEVLL